ncbi:MAG: isochorismatase family protein [Commensalibacter sp.]
MIPSKTALILIEYQNDFTTLGGVMHEAVKTCMEQTNMLENTSNALINAHQKGVKIIYAPIFQKIIVKLTRIFTGF